MLYYPIFLTETYLKEYFPVSLKKQKLLYKYGSKNNMLNFRHISLLPRVAKIYEKAIKYRLNNFLEKYNIINKYQY